MNTNGERAEALKKSLVENQVPKTSAKCGNPGLAWQTRQCLSQMARPNMIM